MPRKPKVIPGPSRLSKIMAELNRHPTMTLSGLSGLKLKLALRNNHFGARHFMKEELPRIRYANPALRVEVNKIPSSKNDMWKPEMVLQYENGQEHVLDLEQKWSTTIVRELMEKAGGDSWAKWKLEAQAAGLPLVPGEEKERLVKQKPQAPPPPAPKLVGLYAEISDMPSDEADDRRAGDSSSSQQPRTGVAAALP